jgi:hypothetical protein
MTIYLEIKGFKQDGQVQNRYGKISFVDLAGSEKVKESKATNDTFTEALSINKSLLTLGKCITALADPKTRNGHIPFRDSKLTRLLMDSLGGKGTALMIACISPSFTNLNETLKTLRYAIQAKKIQNRPSIQLDAFEEKVLNLKHEILVLKKENFRLKELLSKDDKYKRELELILEDTSNLLKRLKSRPNSPIGRARAPSRIERPFSVKLPDISMRKTAEKAPLPRFTTSIRNQNSNPRSSHSSRRRESSKSASSKLRVDVLKKSDAPASHSGGIRKSNELPKIIPNSSKRKEQVEHKTGIKPKSKTKQKNPEILIYPKDQKLQ